jgi:polysaccharide pyruvyl transferase WcaK-like protein
MHSDSSAQRTADSAAESATPAATVSREPPAPTSAPRRKVAVIGYYGNNNAGDEALLSSVLRHIGASPRVAEVLVLSSKPQLTERLHGVPSVEGLIPGTIKDLLVRVLGRNRRNFFRSMRRVLACDTLIVGGGGLFFDSKKGNFDLLQFMSVIRLFQILGKDVFIIGVSSLPLHHHTSRRMFRRVARHPRTRAIVCRDQESAAQFRAARGALTAKADNVYVTEDIVFALPRPQRMDPVVEQYVTRDGSPIVAFGLCGP